MRTSVSAVRACCAKPLVLFIIMAVFSASRGAEVIRRGERIDLADGRLSAILPDGWAKTDLNATDVVAGYATQDGRSSIFLREMDAGPGGGMRELLDATVANFEATFEVREVGKVKTGEVPGKTRKWPAIFTTVEARVKKGPETFEMRFYLFIFDTGESLYLAQASTTQPVREAREWQIDEFLRSLVANW